MMICTICAKMDPGFSWTDTHGVAQCCSCGVPYRLFHYDENHQRIEKPPELQVDDKFVPLIKQYWDETKSRIPSQHSFPGGYELTNAEERKQFYEWLDAHLPSKPQEASHD